MLEELDTHPISEAEDIEFFKSMIDEEKAFAKQCEASINQERQNLLAAQQEKGSPWVGMYPMLRLIHCFF